MSENVAFSPEIQNHLAMAFGEAPIQVQPEPIVEPAANAAPAPDPAALVAPVAGANPPSDDVVYVDPNEYLKQHLGYESIEAAKAELEQLRTKAQTPAEIKYANDEAKRWAEYFAHGKEDELYQSLHARQQVKNIDSLNEEQKIKLFIKMNNPLFDQELVDYQFKKEYGFDESQFKDEDGNVTDPMGLRYAKTAAMQKMQNDLTKAGDFFAQYKSKIELPEIKPQQAAQSNDEGYEGYKASTAKAQETYSNVIVPALNSLSEVDLNMALNINDPSNQMNFDVNVAVDKGDFESAKQNALSFSDWVEKTFYDEKGNFQPKKLARAILLEQQFDKYAQTIARQAVNAERKRMIEAETPTSVVRRDFNITPEVKSELDQKMNLAFSV